MTPLEEDLQKLVDTNASKANTHSLLFAVQSGDRRIDFQGSAGAGVADRFFIASITKMFTAALVLQLVDDGVLDLDMTAAGILDTVDLSDLHIIDGTALGPQLTIRQLMTQTSGLADYFEGGLVAKLKRGEDSAYDLHEVLRQTKALKPQGAPDSGRAYYSDTNYQLLGAVIEAVSGHPFADVVQARICAPLGLTRTEVFLAGRTGPDAPVTLYHKARPLDVPLAMSSMGADGGIVSTLPEMLTFLRAYMTNGLFSAGRTADARHFQRLFFPLRYGAGLMRFKLPRWMNLFRETPELIGHSGASGTFAYYAPAQDIYMTGAFNQLDAPKRPFGFMMQVLATLKRHPRTG